MIVLAIVLGSIVAYLLIGYTTLYGFEALGLNCSPNPADPDDLNVGPIVTLLWPVAIIVVMVMCLVEIGSHFQNAGKRRYKNRKKEQDAEDAG